MLRSLTGLAELGLVLVIWRRGIGYLLWFAAFLYFDAVTKFLPQRDTPVWWGTVFFPLAVLRFALAVAVSVELFAFARRQVYAAERRGVFVGSVLMGGSAVVFLAAWVRHNPGTMVQYLLVFRQYAQILLAAGTTTAAWYFRHLQISARIWRFGALWCIWLWVAAAMGSATKGGFLRSVLPGKEGDVWSTVADVGFYMCLGILAGMYYTVAVWGRSSVRPRVQTASVGSIR